jgi:hypothetical protein
MKNINADTKMRESLSDVDSGDMDV